MTERSRILTEAADSVQQHVRCQTHTEANGKANAVEHLRQLAAEALPATGNPSVITDRAAVLREAADELGRMDYDADSNDYGYDTYRDAWNGGVMDGAALLRRMADEERQPEQAKDRCGQDIETALGTYPCERDADHHGDCDERTEAEIAAAAAEEATR